MAVVTTKSTVIANRDSSPRVLNNANKAAGRVEEFAGSVAVASGDSIGSKYLFGSIPSNARMSSLRVFCDAITSLAGDVGLYRTTDDGGAAVSAAFFKAAQALSSALSGTDIQNGNVETNALGDKMIWEHLGLSADPGIKYDVVITATAAATGAGNITLKGAYAI